MGPRFRATAGAAFILLMCALCVRLGFWQLDRLEQRRARNAVAARGLAAPPAPLTAESLRAIDASPADWHYRRVSVRGAYDPGGEVLLRGRSDGGRPGVHVATPLHTARTGRILLVNRGWIPAADGARPAQRAAPPSGELRVEGILMELPATGDAGQPSLSAGVPSYRRLDLETMRGTHGAALLPVYLQLTTPPGDSLPRLVPAPALDEGPHLGYAIQWFSFAAIGIIGLAVLLRRGRTA